MTKPSSIHSSDATKALGTLALVDEPDWRDYRVSVLLQSASDRAIGVVFRKAAADQYYRFSMDRAAGIRSLVKRVGDNFTTLWSENWTYEPDQPYIVTVDCLGSRLVAYLNGIELVSLEDDRYASGGVGLYCHNNNGAEFHEVWVALAQWMPYYRFAREETLAAGTRIRIHSGRESDPAIAGPNEIQRFVTPPFDGATIQFTDTHIDLRVVGPDGAEHTRRFLADSSYGDVDYKLLRKDDGTATVILPQSGNAFAPGTYRMTFEYRRNNSANDAGAVLSSERGSSEAEDALIDVVSL